MSNAKAPKCPKNKALFSAVDPNGDVSYRSSARDYTHALVVIHVERPARPYVQEGCLLGDVRGPVQTEADLPEGAFDVKPTAPRTATFNPLVYSDGSQMLTYKLNKMTSVVPASTGIWSFHSSAALADKAGRQSIQVAGDTYQVVEVTIVEDRRA